MVANKKIHSTYDEALAPLVYAEQFITNSGPARTAEQQLEMARTIIATELGKDPLMRKEIRSVFVKDAVISVLPTERGSEKIDDYHIYHVCPLVSTGIDVICSFTLPAELQIPARKTNPEND